MRGKLDPRLRSEPGPEALTVKRSTSASPTVISFISENGVLAAGNGGGLLHRLGGRKWKERRALLASALLRLLSSCCLNRSTRANQLLSIAPRLGDVIPQEPGLPDTANIPVPGLRPLRPGSLFTWGHCNANSLSPSISEKITVEAKVAGQRRAKPGKHEAAKGWNQQLMRGWRNGCLSCSEQGGRSSGLLCGGCIVVRGVSEELYPTAYQRLQEMPPKDPLSFTQPRTSTACFIFKAYPVTKDTSVPRLDYMWTSVSSCMEGVWGGEGNVWGRAAPPPGIIMSYMLFNGFGGQTNRTCQPVAGIPRWCGC